MSQERKEGWKEVQVPVGALSQRKRAREQRADKRPGN
ncbi:hypothetical protein, partial [Escherichia coli]